MTFTGWKAEALEFFDELEEENTKAFWERNKHTYETLVRAPMEELLAELKKEWGPGRIFRPYRDVRFSKDKSPYKTNIAAVVGDGYISLDARGLGAGVGMWEMAPDQLARYRQAVDDGRSGAKLARVVSDIRSTGAEAAGHGVLKTAPKGYPKDHPRIELLQYKGIVAWRDWPAGAWLGTKRAKDRVVELFRVAKPLNAWLTANVGPSTSADAGR
jgi:uncharacterized protein (TIGR02453 family)